MEIKLWTAYIANGILIIIGLLILIRAVFCSGPKRKRFLIIMTALLTLSEIFDILYWVFEDKTQDKTTGKWSLTPKKKPKKGTISEGTGEL